MTENKVEDDSFIPQKKCSQSNSHVTLLLLLLLLLQYKNTTP